jgi:hypothetical protein
MSAATEPVNVSPVDLMDDPKACVRRVDELFGELSRGIRHTWAHQVAVEALQDVVEYGTDDPKLEAFFIAVADTLEMLEDLRAQTEEIDGAINDAHRSFDPKEVAEYRARRAKETHAAQC